MGGLRVALCPQRRADATLPQTHRSEAIQVQPLRQVNTHFLSFTQITAEHTAPFAFVGRLKETRINVYPATRGTAGQFETLLLPPDGVLHFATLETDILMYFSGIFCEGQHK